MHCVVILCYTCVKSDHGFRRGWTGLAVSCNTDVIVLTTRQWTDAAGGAVGEAVVLLGVLDRVHCCIET